MTETVGAEVESTLDLVATNAFNGIPQKDSGYFGIHTMNWSER
jgi:hypothetical protein